MLIKKRGIYFKHPVECSRYSNKQSRTKKASQSGQLVIYSKHLVVQSRWLVRCSEQPADSGPLDRYFRLSDRQLRPYLYKLWQYSMCAIPCVDEKAELLHCRIFLQFGTYALQIEFVNFLQFHCLEKWTL